MQRDHAPCHHGQLIWEFAAGGKHLRTLDAYTGGVVYEFGHDGEGLLTSVRDAGGNLTTIARDSVGRPTGIVPQFAPPTVLVTNNDALLSKVIGPNEATHESTYHPGRQLLKPGSDQQEAPLVRSTA